MPTVATSSAIGPGITAASFSLAVPTEIEDGHLVITCNVPESSLQAELYKSLTRPIHPMGRITVDTNADSTEEKGCTAYAALIEDNPTYDTRVPLAAKATEAAAERLQDIYTRGKANGSNLDRSGWRSTLLAFQQFNEDLYYGIVKKEDANFVKRFPQASSSASKLESGQPALPLKLAEDIKTYKRWEYQIGIHRAILTAGKSLASLYKLDSSTTYEPSIQPSGSVFMTAGATLYNKLPEGDFHSEQIDTDISSLKHPDMTDLMEKNGHADGQALRKHLLSNAEEVCGLSSEYGERNMDINTYIERLLAIGKSAHPGQPDTEMPDVEVSETEKDGDTIMTDPED
jgi:hypothetical protein